MTGKLLPFSLFVLDCCLLALPLMLMGSKAAVPPSVLFLLSAIVGGILMTGMLLKSSYHPLRGAGICMLVMSSVLAGGASVYLYMIFVIISFQRLHARFSEQQDEYDGNFLLVFLLVFPFSLFALFLWGEENRLSAFYAISFFSLLFFAGSRLFHRYAVAVPPVPNSSFLIIAGLLILLPTVSASVFYLVVDWIRIALTTAVGGILAFVLQPFEGLLEELVVLLEQFSPEPQESEGEIESTGPPESMAGETVVYDPPFPYEWLAFPMIAAIVIVLLLWLKKQRHLRLEETTAEVPAQVSYGPAVPGQQGKPENKINYSAVDLPFIRKTFREFEYEATKNGFGRDEAETVREWFDRLDWHVSTVFFKTYDSVRYGSRVISEADAHTFLQEIEKLKSFFNNEV